MMNVLNHVMKDLAQNKCTFVVTKTWSLGIFDSLIALPTSSSFLFFKKLYRAQNTRELPVYFGSVNKSVALLQGKQDGFFGFSTVFGEVNS